jgi:hypothetical protein
MKRNLIPKEGDHYMRALLACNRHPARELTYPVLIAA